jgi:Domain of unknown function (DUF5655)
MAEMRTWETMQRRIQAQLERQTDRTVDDWNMSIAAESLPDEASLREWLARHDVTGYPQTLLVWESFGYPEFLLASADELVDAQYENRPHLRPILDAILATAGGFGAVDVQARKTYVSLLTTRRTFAVARATTKKRVDLGLRLSGVDPTARLLAAKGVGSESINMRIGLLSPEDLDDEVTDWFHRAYQENSEGGQLRLSAWPTPPPAGGPRRRRPVSVAAVSPRP